MLLSAFAGCIGLLASCSSNSVDDLENPALARVYDNELRLEEVSGLIPKGLSPEDSLTQLKLYLEDWGRSQLMMAKAEFNLGDQKEEFEKLVAQYRKDLLIHAYQEAYINKNIDTSITEADILDYYQSHLNDFQLKENILKVDFAILPIEGQQNEDIIRFFKKTRSDEENDSLKNILQTAALNATIGDTNWISFSRLENLISLRSYNQESFLKTNKFVNYSDSTAVYLLKIKEYKIQESVSPLAYVKDNIKSVILNKRKLALIEKMEMDLLNDAYEKKDFEIY